MRVQCERRGSTERKRNRTTLLGLSIVVLATLTACSTSTSNGGGTQATDDYRVGSKAIDVADRPMAPDVQGQTLDNRTLGIADFKGHVLVVNAWGSWCAPCRAEAPALQEVYQTSRADGVRFLGIDTRDQVAAAQAFQSRFGITYPSLFDSDGRLLAAFNDSIPPSAIPSTLVIDRQGRIAASIVGPTTYSELEEFVNQVVDESRNSS
jgi:peroxiredoxin